MEYNDGLYVNGQKVLEDLNYIGFTAVRDSVILPQGWGPAIQGLASQDLLADNGISFNFLTNANASLDDFTIPALEYFQQRHPNTIISVEGPNEINNQPVGGPGTNEQNAVAFQSRLYSFVRSYSALHTLPVLYFTGGDPVSTASLNGEANRLNSHPYAQGGNQPYTWVGQCFSANYMDSGADPGDITETGYSTAKQGNYDGVDEPTQASLVLNNIFDGALIGAKHTYLYQLLEAYPNYSTNADTGYGIFRYTDGSPKLAAVALHNLSKFIPKDVVSPQQSIEGMVSGVPTGTGKMIALTASDGSVYLAIWNEVPIWNPGTQTELDATPVTASVYLPGSWTVTYFDPRTNVTSPAVTSEGDGGTPHYTFPVTTHVTLLAFHPAS